MYTYYVLSSMIMATKGFEMIANNHTPCIGNISALGVRETEPFLESCFFRFFRRVFVVLA